MQEQPLPTKSISSKTHSYASSRNIVNMDMDDTPLSSPAAPLNSSSDNDWQPAGSPTFSSTSSELSFGMSKNPSDSWDGVSTQLCHKEPKYIVFHSSLQMLMKWCHCPSCGSVDFGQDWSTNGTQLIIKLCCQSCEMTNKWVSQPSIGKFAGGNLLPSAGILFAGASPAKVLRVLAHMTEAAVLSQQAKDLVQGSQQLLEGFQVAAQQMSSVGDKLTTATSHLLTVTSHPSSLVVSMEKRLEQFSTCPPSRGSSPCPSCCSSRSSSRSTSRSPSPTTPSTTQDDRNQLRSSESSARSPSAPSLPDMKPEAQPKVQHRPCDQVQDAQETPSGNHCGTSGTPTHPTTPPKDPSQPTKVTHEGPHVSFRTRNQTPELS